MIYVGIDVSKATLEVAIHGQPAVRSFTNDRKGLARLVSWLAPHGPGKIVLEATGGYEQVALDTLHAAGWPVARVNPRQARDFAKGCGQLAKTDALDARVLAQLAQVVNVPLYQPPSTAQRAIRAHHQRRDQLRAMLQAEIQHERQETDAACRRDIRQHIAQLRRRLTRVEETLRAQVQACPEHVPLGSIKGVGPILQSALLAYLPELGRLRGKEIAKLVGVAPLARDSGTWHGQRIVWGGRARIRSVLYMATLTATRYDPRLRAFYQALRARGKAGKVALVACMRKLLIILNARMRDVFATDLRSA